MVNEVTEEDNIDVTRSSVGPPTSLLIVDDHPIVRDGLRGILDPAPGFTVLGEACDGAEAVEKAVALDPDVILMDLRMPRLGGVDAIIELSRRGVRAKILVLTTWGTDSDVLLAVEAGATGYLLKDAPRDELFAGVRTVAEGRSVFSPAIASHLASALRAPRETPTKAALSTRELEVLVLVARGSSNREIADELFISEATVKTHLKHLYAKLGVNDRAAAVARAYERGLLGNAAPNEN